MEEHQNLFVLMGSCISSILQKNIKKKYVFFVFIYFRLVVSHSNYLIHVDFSCNVVMILRFIFLRY